MMRICLWFRTEVLQLSDLTALDTLRVVGIDKKIYSISVTTGHGSLKLVNTSVFDGSYIQVGSKVFAQITGEMTIEILREHTRQLSRITDTAEVRRLRSREGRRRFWILRR